MKAVWYESLGPAGDVLKFGELPTPNPGENEVLVKLSTSGVNPSDVKMRAGTRAGGTAMPYPKITPHSDGAGVVTDVGVGVDKNLIGTRVWISNGQWQRAYGTSAEYIAINKDLVFPLPDGVSFEVGASLGIPALTACHAVFSNGDVAGKTILINGGGGTVGYLAVQLASRAGARVIATEHGEEACNRAKRGGAEHVLDFTDKDLADKILAANDNQLVDRVIEVEFGCNIETDAKVLKPRGELVTYGSAIKMTPELPFYNLLFKGINVEFILVYLLNAQERAAAAKIINNALMDQELDIPIHSTYDLADTANAHQQVENGRSGSVIIDIA